jgi:hypothetical protein
MRRRGRREKEEGKGREFGLVLCIVVLGFELRASHSTALSPTSSPGDLVLKQSLLH